MSIEDQGRYVALPKLRGQPAYARPPRPMDPGPRPFDPDALPLAAAMTDEERALLGTLPDRAWRVGEANLTEDSIGLVPRTA